MSTPVTPSNPALHFASPIGADLHQVETEIARYSAKKRLTRSLAGHLAKLELERKALLAPIHKLPDDILTEIFQIGAEECSKPIKFSLKVSWVVSRWRRVALGTPALWSDVHVIIRRDGPTTESWKTFVERSATRLLTVTAALHTPQLDHEIVPLDQLIPRCNAFRLIGTSWPTFFWTIPICPSSAFFPLSKLELTRVRLDSRSRLLIFLRSCPRLRELHLSRILFANDTAGDEVTEFEDLVALSLVDLWMRHGGNQMSICPILQYLKGPQLRSLTVSDEAMMQWAFNENYRSITTLNIQGGRWTNAMQLIDVITAAPALKHLSLDLSLLVAPRNLPTEVSLPSLVSINFNMSSGVDQLARWLVERTSSTLEVVSAYSENARTWQSISPSVLEWIRERVPMVVFNLTYD